MPGSYPKHSTKQEPARHTLTQPARTGIFRDKFYEQKLDSQEKQGSFSASLCSTTSRKSYVFSSLISLLPPSLNQASLYPRPT